MVPLLWAVAGAVARAAYDAECCQRISHHLSQLSLTQKGSHDSLGKDLYCGRVSMPSSGCSLVVPTQMSCCARNDTRHAATMHQGLFSLDQLRTEQCNCENATDTAAKPTVPVAQTQLSRGKEADGRAALVSSSTGAACHETATSVRCSYNTSRIAGRDVLFALPPTAQPVKGYPVAFAFECWKGATVNTFEGDLTCDGQTCKYDKHMNKAKVAMTLLEHGYAVVAVPSRTFGEYGNYWESNKDGEAWHTNKEPAGLSAWSSASAPHDHHVLTQVFDVLKQGSSGAWGHKFDLSRLHAYGFSSGGFMTSRMGVNPIDAAHPFSSLVTVAAGLFYCPVCDPYYPLHCECPEPDDSVKARLRPEHHPPTLLLHCEGDELVSSDTSTRFVDQLKAASTKAQFAHLAQGAVGADSLIEANGPNTECGHAWPHGTHAWVLKWFETHTTAPSGARADRGAGHERKAATSALAPGSM